MWSQLSSHILCVCASLFERLSYFYGMTSEPTLLLNELAVCESIWNLRHVTKEHSDANVGRWFDMTVQNRLMG